MNDDAALLRCYVEEGSEPAFTALVRRHVDLVYGAALRRVGGDPHRAAEVAQQVFTTLAREARKLARHPQLAAWLHTATRNASLNLMISEQRRQARETAALALESVGGGIGASGPAWEQLQALLDAAIDELPETDRVAVVLRFLERRPFAEIGAALKVSEDAARVRTDRALDKLRTALVRRGITSTGAALGAIMAGQPLVAAPAGLGAALALESLASAGVGLAAGAAVTFMSTKLITTALLSALVAFSVGTYVGNHRETSAQSAPQVHESSQQTQALAAMRRDNQRLTAEVSALQADVARLNAAAEADRAAATVAAQRIAAMAKAAAKSPIIGVPVWDLQGAVLNNLRQINAARKQYELEKGHPAASLSELVGPKGMIRTVRTVGGENYADLSMVGTDVLSVTTPDGVNVIFDPTGATTTKPEVPPEVAREMKIQPSVLKAVDAYRMAHGGALPPNEAALVSYFATPQEGADFVEVVESRKAKK
ncbi:MAG: sigma-70 family RNA polymerase sigma factor [Undibacterium sp.]|nr:sigma-70 family RNA polymerase sigma factor [Opitutaceae bacterium]